MNRFFKFSDGVGAYTALALLFAFVANPAIAQTCDQNQLAAAIDGAGEKLRQLTKSTQPALQAKLLRLKQAKGWTDQEYEEKGYMALEDERTAKLDAAANQLLARLDTLGGDSGAKAPDCARIAEVESVSLELQATVRAKSQYVLNRLDQLAGESTATAPPAVTIAPAPVMKAPDKAAERPPAVVAAPAPAPQVATPPKATPPPKTDNRWATQTKSNEPAAPVAPAPPVPQAPVTAAPAATAPIPAPPAQAQTEADGYTIDEIVDASRGLFGKVSANLARVLEHAFSKSGRPTGYILGQETGGAFIAGLRYGSGTMYLRTGGTMPVFWHGPSLGADFGAQGAATLFLVYKVNRPEDVFSNFTGIEGSAFVVGGLGMTYMSNGRIDMAPIRSGIGLRIGANLGYVRFTSKPTWNPF